MRTSRALVCGVHVAEAGIALMPVCHGRHDEAVAAGLDRLDEHGVLTAPRSNKDLSQIRPTRTDPASASFRATRWSETRTTRPAAGRAKRGY